MAVKRNNTRMKQSEHEVARMQGESHAINVIHTIPYHTIPYHTIPYQQTVPLSCSAIHPGDW